MDFQEARSSFPGLMDKTFLDAACVSLMPTQAAQAVKDFLEMALHCPAEDASLQHINMDALRQEAVIEGARLLNACTDEIALVESTTHGLNIAATAIDLSSGDNVIICDLEFLQVAIPWVKMQETRGINIRMVPNREGRILVEDIERSIDEHTKAVCVSSVQWSNGYRLDLKSLRELTRLRGIYLIVDAVHQLGAINLDVQDIKVDFLTAGGHKWLNSPLGTGLLYIRQEIQDKLSQSYYGYLGLTSPEGGWAEYFATPGITPLRPYDFMPTAKRFEINGTSNYPGAISLGKSLKIINDIGIKNIEQRIFYLTDLLQNKLREIGVRLVTHPEKEVRSGITVFRYYDHPDKDMQIVKGLLRERIYVAVRYTSYVGGIRISTHFYNNEDDIDHLCTVLRKLI